MGENGLCFDDEVLQIFANLCSKEVSLPHQRNVFVKGEFYVLKGDRWVEASLE